MSLLILSISIWIIVVYSTKVFVSGNPAYGMVKAAPQLVLNQAADCLESEMLPENETIYFFIKRFFRLTAIAFVLFVLEIGLLFYFVYTEPRFIIPWIMLSKNLVMLWLGYSLHRRRDDNIFESVLQIPPWVMHWERVSYLITAACFLYLFLRVNKLVI